jgi:hypothetical protein
MYGCVYKQYKNENILYKFQVSKVTLLLQSTNSAARPYHWKRRSIQDSIQFSTNIIKLFTFDKKVTNWRASPYS